MWRTCLAGLCLASLVTAASAHATPPNPLDVLATAHVQQAVLSALPEALHSRLKLKIRILGHRGVAQKDCASGWTLGAIPIAQPWARLPVTVQCKEQKGSVVARINVQAPVWVLRTAAPAGHVVTEKDLLDSQRRIHRAGGAPALSALRGLQLRRDTLAGHALQLTDLERPVLARKGEQVEIRASNADGVTVSVAGIAAKTGRLGDHDRIRNARSQQWVSGTWVGHRIFEAGLEKPSADGVRVEQELLD